MAKSNPLRFQIHEMSNAEGSKHPEGFFSRDMDDEEEMDVLQERLDRGLISVEKALIEGRRLLVACPDNLELRNFVGCQFWASEMRDEAAAVWETAYNIGAALIPKGFKGRISWYEIDNRSFMRCCYGQLLGLCHRGLARPALSLARKMLRWNPDDNQGVRFLIPDLQFMAGELDAALASYLKHAPEQPTLWYSAALIELRRNDYVRACTYLRRGITGNPYVAEALTGRTLLANHLYWHSSNLHGTDFAIDYLRSPMELWSDKETDFVDWVFNSAGVLRERADLMEIHEALTIEHDIKRRGPWVERLTSFPKNIDDRLSNEIIRKIENHWGDEIWPWDREGRNHPATVLKARQERRK